MSSTVNMGMFTSTTDEWGTPRNFFNALHREFDFGLDACASALNHKVARHFTREDDSLKQPWAPSTTWMNPPYGRQIGFWVKKAYEESLAGATVVCLIPARTCTAYWHDYVMKAAEVRFIRGRLHFEGDVPGGVAHNAPFPSALVIFRPGHDGLPVMRTINRDGKVVQ